MLRTANGPAILAEWGDLGLLVYRKLCQEGLTRVRYATFIGLVIGGVGLLLSSQALAFKLNGANWAYMSNPMGENWTICPAGMPGDAVQRTKDGSAA